MKGIFRIFFLYHIKSYSTHYVGRGVAGEAGTVGQWAGGERGEAGGQTQYTSVLKSLGQVNFTFITISPALNV